MKETGHTILRTARCRLMFVVTILALVAGCSKSSEEAVGGYDVLIVNGEIHAGSPGPPRQANIGITDGRIISMEADSGASAARIIDASGHLVIPGFIDPHTHALTDLISDENNANANYLMQGVTTVFVGSDGGGIPDFATTMTRMKTQGIGSNAAFFAGHGDIREQVMGLENRAPTDQELNRMRAIVEEQMRAGAIGLSTGRH